MDLPEEARQIEDLRDKHKGEETWILGTGPSMDDYPDDFFDDKISIAMKWCAMAFPNCTYNLFRPRAEIAEFLLSHPELIKKHIYPVHPKKKIEWLGKYINDPIYMNVVKLGKPLGKGRRELPPIAETKKIFFEAVHYIKKEKKPYSYPKIDGHHISAIEAAAILGAQKITLVGCEEKRTKESTHAKKLLPYYQGKIIPTNLKMWCPRPIPKESYTIQQIEENWNSPIWKYVRLTTQWLAQALELYGIEIFYYHLKDSEQYKAGYLKII